MNASREFAYHVVERLRGEGYQAYWAGGCVRDLLMGIPPKDFDVATDALPDQVRAIFGRRRTLAIGAAFGVICIIAPRGASNVEVATFREDGGYSDGRHPDAVAFSTPQADAQRRDFTINGMFYDPVADQVHDWVDGKHDLKRRLIRAIGDPGERFREDKLRMLRAVRFACTFDFALDADTKAAIEHHAVGIAQVSAERVGAELEKIVSHPNRVLGVELLESTRLFQHVLPEVTHYGTVDRTTMYDLLRATPPGDVVSPFAGLLWPASARAASSLVAETVRRRLRYPNQWLKEVNHLLRHESDVRHASPASWPKVQRLLAAPHHERLLQFATAVARTIGEPEDSIQFCQEQVSRPRDQWDPPPLLTGNDLVTIGLPRGPHYRVILEAVRDQQLLGMVQTAEAARHLAQRLYRKLDS